MFELSDFRDTGMPVLATTTTPEEAWATADPLGIREHAWVTPQSPPCYGYDRTENWHRADLAAAGAERFGQLVLDAVYSAPSALRAAA